MKLALVPINVKVGDFEENLKKILTQIEIAVKQGASLVVFPELSLIGYPAQDLLLRPTFAKKCAEQLDALHEAVKKYPKLAVVVGTALELPQESSNPTRKLLVNCAVFLQGERKEIRIKTLIPFYDIFYESRYFESAIAFDNKYRSPILMDDGTRLGILICEDSWHNMKLHGQQIHTANPTKYLIEQGVDFCINISASPYNLKKRELRRETIALAAKEYKTSIFYVNHFGAQDEILFDGDAFACAANGNIVSAKEDFNGEILLLESALSEEKKSRKLTDQNMRDLHSALVCGIRDYAKKNNFQKFVLGVSGGIDSALVATLACDAVGPENVLGLVMPSKFSSVASIEDAELLAANLGMKLKNFPIKFLHSTFNLALKPFFEGKKEDITEENLQSRLRGVGIMAFSNKFNYLPLATGNKSEFAMGYTTLYGDMCGALAPIGDLYKTEIYALAHFLNQGKIRIPERTITKAPSAELRANQTDQDTLPPYELLDAILLELIEKELEPKEAKKSLEERFPKLSISEIEKIQKQIQISEYKRRQAPPILRVSLKAFGMGRLYPITAVVQ